MRIEGVGAVMAALNNAPGRARSRSTVPALRRGGALLRKRARELAPRKTGLLRRTIHTIILRRPKQWDPAIVVRTGTRQQMGIPRDAKGYYPAFVEFGAPSRNLVARKFMRRAFEQVGDTAVMVVYERLADEIPKQVRIEFDRRARRAGQSLARGIARSVLGVA